MNERGFRRCLVFVLILFFLAPFLIIAFHSIAFQIPALDRQMAETLAFASLQAGCSAVLAVGLGAVGAVGLIGVAARHPKTARACEIVALLPNAVPVILLILAFLKAFPELRGLFGVIAVHVFLNVGLISVAITRLFRERIAQFSELAWVEGASRWRFFSQGVWPHLRSDFLILGLFVFALCFSSFAVPLVIGGAHSATIEVSIYQSLRERGDFAEALVLALLQAVTIFIFSLLFRQGESAQPANRAVEVRLLQWRPGVLIALLPAALLVWGLCDGVQRGWHELARLGGSLDELPNLFFGSLMVGTGTGVSVAGLLFALVYVYPQGLLRRILLGYAAPSTVLTGFALLIFWRAVGFASYCKIVLGLTLILTPAFYRLYWDSALRALDGQRVVAESLGASRHLTFVKVLLPQLVAGGFFIAGLASVWAWGDFALSSVVAERNLTLAMAAQGLMESYRLNAATILIWLVSLGGLVSFAIFTGVGRVLGAKSKI